jgi:hypothetical protein
VSGTVAVLQRRSSRRDLAAVAVFSGVSLVLGGCGLLPGRRREIEVAASSGLTDAVIAVGEDHEPRDVAMAIGDEFDWDRFTVYTIGTPGERINEESGVIVEPGEHYTTQEILYVFHRDGVAVRGVPLPFENLAYGAGTWWGPRTRILWDDEWGTHLEDPDA